MAKRPIPSVGDVMSWERTFTVEEIAAFAKLSGDEGVHHMTPDDKGRIRVHGLLTMSLPTHIGGELDFIASEMSYQFMRPVFAGQTIRCDVEVLSRADEPDRVRLEMSSVCRNPDGKEVLRGRTKGVILIS